MVPGPSLLRAALVASAVAAATLWMAFEGGAYSAVSRGTIAVVVLWALAFATALTVWPAQRVPREAVAVITLLAAFVVVTGISAFWAASAEKAVDELNRTALYLGVVAVAVAAGRRADLPGWLAGLAISLATVGLVALTSRLFPDLFAETSNLAQLFAPAEQRLSYPVAYWNGLATVTALSLPLLLYFATSGRSTLVRGAALAPMPALAGTIYLTSSRGGAITAVLAVLIFAGLTGRRWAAAAAASIAGAGGLAVVAILHARPELVDNPLRSELAAGQGRSAAGLITLVCLGVGAIWALAVRFAPAPPRLPTAARAVGAVAIVVLALGALAAADPRERFERFKEPPPGTGVSVQEHLFSGSGSGRWQLWEVAGGEFESEPLIGHGAGSYEAAWAQEGTLSFFVRDAHSLYLETLAELGIVGFALLLVTLVAAFAVGLRRVRAHVGDERSAVAALVALLMGYAFEAGIDWMWELTVVSVVAFAAIGLLVGPATLAKEADRPRRAPALRAAVVAILLVLLVVETAPLLAELKIKDSREAAAAGELTSSLDAARAAESLEPWGATPRLQTALVQELAGRIEDARESIGQALDRDPSDWRLWLVAARIETKAGEFEAALDSLGRARELNPRSPLFAIGG
jgi:O-antigen ligase/polysaccharide polymerase Wzy-like membrane protein/tetratricopeptide repeat protein